MPNAVGEMTEHAPHRNQMLDVAMQHAFAMVGTKNLFLCHLTMLHMEEHMYEVVLRARLPRRAMRTFHADRDRHPNVTYFLGNCGDDLLEIPDLKAGARKWFRADVFRSLPMKPVYNEWPWNGVEPLIADVRVTVEEVVCYRHYNLGMQYPEHLMYTLFGADGEAFLYHYQTREPDYDQVVALSEAPDWLEPVLLRAGVTVSIPSLDGPPLRCSNPLTAQEYAVNVSGLPDEVARPIRIDRSVWFCTKVTNHHNPCAPQRDPDPCGC